MPKYGFKVCGGGARYVMCGAKDYMLMELRIIFAEPRIICPNQLYCRFGPKAWTLTRLNQKVFGLQTKNKASDRQIKKQTNRVTSSLLELLVAAEKKLII